MKIWQNYGLQTLIGQIDNGLHLLLSLCLHPSNHELKPMVKLDGFVTITEFELLECITKVKLRPIL